MTPHLNEEQVRSYRDRSLAPADLLRASGHIAECGECRARVAPPGDLYSNVEALRRALEAESVPPAHLTYDEIAAYVDGQAAAGQTAHVEAHARECPLCAADIAQIKALTQEMESSRHQPILRPQSVADFVRSLFTWKGSLTLAAAAAGVFLVVFLLQKPANPPVTARLPQAAAPSAVAQVAAIHDGSRTISLAVDGSVSGLETLSPSWRASIGRVLAQREIPAPGILADLTRKDGVLLGGSTEASAVVLLGPLGIVVETQRPLFQWKPVAAAEYRVSVYNAAYDRVAVSDWTSATEWQAPSPLPRGGRYSWQLNVRLNGQEQTVPAPPAPEARFRVLDAAGEAGLASLKATAGDSHLVLGVAYAQAGMLDDAARELRVVRDENPESPVAQGLLSGVQHLRNAKP
jgi:anti-sigma factor RsiW